MTRTTCLVCFISTVNDYNKKKKEKKTITSGASSGHITILKQSIILRCLWLGRQIGPLTEPTFNIMNLEMILNDLIIPTRGQTLVNGTKPGPSFQLQK